MAKKIMALVMTIALVVCFAVSASAINVETVTTYTGNNTADVTVTVSGVTAGNNVTYYAVKGSSDVFVDQKEAESTSVVFNYETDIANVGSSVKVGYTNADAEGATIPDAAKYTIKYEGATLAEVYPTEGTTVTFDYTPAAYTTVTGVNATNATVTDKNIGDTSITVTLANVSGNVELTVTTSVIDIPAYTGTLSIVDAGAVLVKASEDPAYQGGIKIDAVKEDLGEFTPDSEDAAKIAAANANAVNDRKLTVAGAYKGEALEYGIIVSTEAIATENLRPAAFDALYADKTYKALDVAPNGQFAVQLIDTSATDSADAFVKVGTSYYTAVYAKTADACYVVAYATAVAAN